MIVMNCSPEDGSNEASCISIELLKNALHELCRYVVIVGADGQSPPRFFL